MDCSKFKLDGISPACEKYVPKGNCTCCYFKPELGNFIGLLPGEEHLFKAQMLDQVGDNPYTVRCTVFENGETECPLGDDRPIDCKLYPVFPADVDLETNTVTWIFGQKKCPMNKAELMEHAERAKEFVLDLCRQNPDVIEVFRQMSTGFKGYVFEDQLVSRNGQHEDNGSVVVS